MLRSQSGPGAGLALSATPSNSCRIAPHLFPVVLGHRRAACARAGVLGRRGFALESAAASVPRRRRQGIDQRDGEIFGLEGA